ncbi:MAG: hypothetical protein FWF90_17340 [Promicromonosporaceae bacterium]|nr:hypothetical protein [Promicromonosporaceae bacterium]
MPRQLTFWFAVGGIALIAPVVFNLAVNKVQDRFPALDTFRDFLNGNGDKG